MAWLLNPSILGGLAQEHASQIPAWVRGGLGGPTLLEERLAGDGC